TAAYGRARRLLDHDNGSDQCAVRRLCQSKRLWATGQSTLGSTGLCPTSGHPHHLVSSHPLCRLGGRSLALGSRMGKGGAWPGWPSLPVGEPMEWPVLKLL